MQEDIENKTITLVISATKLTGRVLKAAVSKYLAHRKEVKQNKKLEASVTPRGKQSVKELVGQNQGVSNIEITDKNIRDFDRVARKYGVDYAVKKVRSVSNPRGGDSPRGGEQPKYLVFFKARDADALTAAFTEYSTKRVKQASCPSVLEKLRKFKELVKSPVADRTKRKERER